MVKGEDLVLETISKIVGDDLSITERQQRKSDGLVFYHTLIPRTGRVLTIAKPDGSMATICSEVLSTDELVDRVSLSQDGQMQIVAEEAEQVYQIDLKEMMSRYE